MKLESYSESGEVLKLTLLPAWGPAVNITGAAFVDGVIRFTNEDGSTFDLTPVGGPYVGVDNGNGTVTFA